MATYCWQWWYPFTPAQLWPRISDTDWINKRAGLPPVRYHYDPLPAGGSRTTATIALGPFKIRWFEPPWDWVEGVSYQVVRTYLGGPLRSFTSATRLIPERDGTTIEMTVDLIGRNLLGRLLLPLVAAFGHAGAARALKAASITLKGDEAQSFADPIASKSELFAAKRVADLEYAQDMLEAKGFAPELVYRFVSYLATAEDRELAKMRPFELADRWNADRMDALRLFLTATRGGLLNLKWDVICPGCRGGNGAVDSLGELQAGVHCPACNVNYGPQFDRSVEVTFNAGPLGKGVDVPIFCLAGPHNTPHIIAQAMLEPGARASMAIALEAGHYVAAAIGVASASFEWHAGEKVSTLAARVSDTMLEGIPDVVYGKALALEIRSAATRSVPFKVVKPNWPDTITTAAQVTALQDFRDLFSSEVLATGLELGIQSMTVLFTDLVGSTELYSKGGDAPAFKIVHDHFTQMRAVIAAKNGAIVKTIGDAVMAVFVDPAAAFEAALLLPRVVGKIATPHGNLALRVGFHSGPCIAMRANERLDYFGTTVNLAARIQHSAASGEVLFSQSCAMLPSIAAKLAVFSRPTRTESVAFKGFSQEVPVVRVMAIE